MTSIDIHIEKDEEVRTRIRHYPHTDERNEFYVFQINTNDSHASFYGQLSHLEKINKDIKEFLNDTNNR